MIDPRKEPYAITLLGRVLAGDSKAVLEAEKHMLKRIGLAKMGRPLTNGTNEDLVKVARLVFEGKSIPDIARETGLPKDFCWFHSKPSKAMLRACEEAGRTYYQSFGTTKGN